MSSPANTFCALPFWHIDINPDGTAQLCCRASPNVVSRLLPRSLDTSAFEDLWNSQYMRQVRRDMVAGNPVAACRSCYEAEADGARSMRQESNANGSGRFGGAHETELFERAQAIVSGHDARAERPSSMHLTLGNLCNLKCRMCNPRLSSQIGADEVHRRWNTSRRRSLWMGVSTLVRNGAPAAGQRLGLADDMLGRPRWLWDDAIVAEEVLPEQAPLRTLEVTGGEPLINPRLPAILDLLVRRGSAADIDLYFVSNGTVYSRQIAERLRRFKSASIAFSVDGLGPLHEYIRPPSQWDAVVRNLRSFAGDGVSVAIQPTPQAYNVLGLLDLVRLCDTEGIPVLLSNVLRGPSHLSFDMLPQAVVDEALDEWGEYRAMDGRPRVERFMNGDYNRDDEIDVVTAALRRPRPKRIAELQDRFIRFTNDLDETRGQSLRAANPRLYDRLLSAGLVFEGKYRFVR